MTNTSSRKQAVILSGGGADGAYEIGVLKALFSGQSPATAFQPLDPDIITGTSIGSYNAAFLVSQWETHGGPAAIDNLAWVWLNKFSSSPQTCGNGIFRLRGNPWEFINPICFMPNPLKPFTQLAEDSAMLALDGLQRVVDLVTAQDASLLERVVDLFNFASFVSREPFMRTLDETICFANIRQSQKQLRIAATDWTSGVLRVFTNHYMTDDLGPLVILASSSIPGFWPPAQIGDLPFVDGGVLMNTPLKLAIDAGADVLHVIYLDPDIQTIPVGDIHNTLGALYRTQTIGWAHSLSNDISIAEHTNKEAAYAQLIAEVIDTLQQRDSDKELFKGLPMEEISRHLKQSAHYRQLTIHLYHPRADLGGPVGLLNFDRNRIQGLIEQGFDDALNCSSADYTVVRPFHLPSLSSQLGQ